MHVSRTAKTPTGLTHVAVTLDTLSTEMDSVAQIMMSAHWGLPCVFKTARTLKAPMFAAVLQNSPSTQMDTAAMMLTNV